MILKKIFVLLLLLPTFHSVSAQGEVNLKKEREATRVIKFSNAVISMSNAYISAATAINDAMVKGDNVVSRIVKNPNYKMTRQLLNPNMMEINEGYILNYKDYLSLVPKFKNKGDLDKLIVLAQKDIDAVFDLGYTYNDYFLNQEFKGDDQDFSNYNSKRKKLENAVIKARRSWSDVSQMALTIGDEAENVFYKNNPFSKFAIPMKLDLRELKDLVESAYADKENLNWSTVLDNCGILHTKFTKLKTDKVKNFDKLEARLHDDFEKFYEDGLVCIESIETLASAMLDGKYDDSDQRGYYKVENLYNEISDNYNFAVESYNIFTSSKLSNKR